MYNKNRLEWHQGAENQFRTPQVSVWSCRIASESFGLIFKRLAVAHAMSQDHRASCGVFSFGTDRVTHDTLQGLHGLPSQNTPHSYTPESKRRTALIRRLLKQLVHGGNKASCISELIRQAHLVLFGFSMLIGVNE